MSCVSITVQASYRSNLLKRMCPRSPCVTCSVQVKKGLVEIYDATTRAVKEALARERQTTPIRFLHVSVDHWRGGKSACDDKYIGKDNGR